MMPLFHFVKKTLRQEKRIHRKKKSKLGRSESESIFSAVVVLMAVGHPGGNVKCREQAGNLHWKCGVKNCELMRCNCV